MHEDISPSNLESKKARLTYRWYKVRDLFEGQLTHPDDRSTINEINHERRISKLIREDQSAFAHREFNTYLTQKVEDISTGDLTDRARKLQEFLLHAEYKFGRSNIQLFVLENEHFKSIIKTILERFDALFTSYSALLSTEDGVTDFRSLCEQTTSISDLLSELDSYSPNNYETTKVNWNLLFFKLAYQSVDNYLREIHTMTALHTRAFSRLFTSVLGYYSLNTMLGQIRGDVVGPSINYRDPPEEVRNKLSKFLILAEEGRTIQS